MAQHVLYPPIEPYNAFHFEVSDTHSVYVEQCGNPQGIPVIFIHGGPGAGCGADDRRFFNPEKYRAILFDQRGCGRSTPLACIEDNSTEALVGDIDKLRQHFDIDKWIVFGGSWGSTLSLVYSQTHPENVQALVIRGIFLGTDEEIDYLNNASMRRFYPQEYLEYVNLIEESKRDNLQKAYYEILRDGSKAQKLTAAKHYRDWEMNSAFLTPPAAFSDENASAEHIIAEALIQTHFMVNKCFLTPNQIKLNAQNIAHIPIYIVHGRYDLLCAVQAAYELHTLLPHSELNIMQTAGHVSREEGSGQKLVEIMDALANKPS